MPGMPVHLCGAAPDRPAPARVLLRRAGGVVAQIDDDVVAGFWQRTFDLALARELRRALVEACDRHPGPVLLTGFQTAQLDARAFGDERVRAELVALARDVIPRVRAYALVVEGTGFAAAALRAGSAGITLLARSPCPCRTFRDLASASAWALPLRPAPVASRAAVDAALGALRASLERGEGAR